MPLFNGRKTSFQASLTKSRVLHTTCVVNPAASDVSVGFALPLLPGCQEVDFISLQKRSERGWPACKATGGVMLTSAPRSLCLAVRTTSRWLCSARLPIYGLHFTELGRFDFSAGQTRVEASSHPSEMEDFSLACWHIRGSVLLPGGNPSCRLPYPALPFSVEHVEFSGTFWDGFGMLWVLPSPASAATWLHRVGGRAALVLTPR